VAYHPVWVAVQFQHHLVVGEEVLLVGLIPVLEDQKVPSALQGRRGPVPVLASCLDSSFVLAGHVSEEADHQVRQVFVAAEVMRIAKEAHFLADLDSGDRCCHRDFAPRMG